MRDPKKKCIAKKCEDCNFYQSWDMEIAKANLRKTKMKCSLQVLFEEIPQIRGSIDGCQVASNETKNVVIDFGSKAVKTLRAAFQSPVVIDHTFKEIEE
jgi:hypothetical protein